MSLDRPLAGTVVIDATRMLPGAVLARLLADLGARIIKVEEPGVGDPMRAVPPLVGGTGAGFHAFYHGAESIALDLASSGGATALRRLARHADVLVESFRPGTMERWGVGHDRLTSTNPLLVTCSLSAFGSRDAAHARIAAH
ncbi:MAG TPA: CoA transferase, partial [Gemmatimonadaceae bacterium]|nr:CoA transferase [Gemmatimonadaceae bacterium]